MTRKPTPPMDLIDRVAAEMRLAYNKHIDGVAPIPYEHAAAEPREAWRVCARAAIKLLGEAHDQP